MPSSLIMRTLVKKRKKYARLPGIFNGLNPDNIIKTSRKRNISTEGVIAFMTN